MANSLSNNYHIVFILAIMAQKFVLPGAVLGPLGDFKSGPGTHCVEGSICASLAGVVSTDDDRTIEVKHWRRRTATGAALVPQVGSVVSGKITRITASQANVDIICCGEVVLPQPAQGVIRVEDVFPAAVDHTAVQMSNCFRPGDVIKARLTSIGDSKQYWLSTAEPALGVAWARGGDGDVLLPVAWDEMLSPATGAKQPRKAARPVDIDQVELKDKNTSSAKKVKE